MRAKLVAVATCLSLCAWSARARADLYRWVDAQGRMHVSDDKSEVPAGSTVTVQPTRIHGAGSASNTTSKGAAPAAPAARPVLAVERDARKGVGRTHVLRFQRAGHEIALDVTLGERTRCDFKVDTGASLNTVPAWVVRELGIEIDRDTPRISLVGISGKPALVPLIVIPSVRVGSVYVENVEMAVLDTMQSGLLGMPFFNHFKVQIDPAEGELRLTEIDLDGVDGIYGGMGEDEWKQRFHELQDRLASIRKARESVPEESETMAQNYFDKLDRLEATAQHDLDELEDRAQTAGVPANWR